MDTQEGIFLKELQGVQIRVDNDGKFLAVIAGKLVKKPTLREIEKEIAKHTAGIRVFSFDEFSFREVEIIILPRCSECTRYHPMKDLAWNKSGELVCPDCRRSAEPVKTEPGRSSGDLLQAISERVFNMWGSY